MSVYLPRVSGSSTSELLLFQLVHMIVSYGAWHLFKTEKLDLSQDFLGCFRWASAPLRSVALGIGGAWASGAE